MVQPHYRPEARPFADLRVRARLPRTAELSGPHVSSERRGLALLSQNSQPEGDESSGLLHEFERRA